MWSNWSGEQRCAPVRIATPSNIDEVVDEVLRAGREGRTVRPAGAGHSFTGLIPTDGVVLSLDRMTSVLSVDRAQRRVRVQAGIHLYELNQELAWHGLALENLGDIDRQSIAGATATGTHGTGEQFGNLSSLIVGLTLVTGTGEVVRCSEEELPDLWRAARVSLGALGIVCEVELQCVEAFTLRGVDAPAPLQDTVASLDRLVADADHFEFFAFPHADTVLTRTNRRVADPPAPRSAGRELLEEVVLMNAGFGLGCEIGRRRTELIPTLHRVMTKAAGSSTRVDRSYRIFASRRLVRFVEMEYALPRHALPDVLTRARAWIARERFPVTFPMEVRVGAGDDAYLSPAHDRDSAYLAVHVSRGMPWEPFFRTVEALCDEYDGRPHWGKRHFQSAETLEPRFPQWSAFAEQRERCDPKRVFTNTHIARVLGP